MPRRFKRVFRRFGRSQAPGFLSPNALAAALDQAGDMIITTDINRRVTSFNKGGEAMLGYSPADLMGRDVAELYADPEERWALSLHVAEMGSVANYETELIHKQGHTVFVSLTLSQLKNRRGRMIGTVGISKDISDRLAVEEKLRKSRAELVSTRDYLDGVLETITDAVITTTVDGRIYSFNRGAEIMLGYGRHEAIGRRVESLYPDPRERAALFRRLLEGGPVRSYETRLVRKDGRLVDVLLALALLKDAQGRVLGTVGTSKDVTELKELQARLVSHERLAAIGQTVTGLAHCIKNMVGGLKGGSYMVNVGAKRRRQDLVDEGWETVEKNIQRISMLALDMLHLAKDREPEYAPTDINGLVGEVLALMAERARELHVALETDLAPLPAVLADAQAIHRALLNLVLNAVEAFMYLEDEDRARGVLVSTRLEGGRVLIAVEDNAAGIPPEAREKLFNEFFTSKPGLGTGLGLAVTKKIMDEHAGSVGVDSRPGLGSIFTLGLPARRV